MPRRFFLSAVLMAAMVLLAANAAVHRQAMKLAPYKVVRTITSAPAAIDVLGIGNSLMGSGFDAAAVEQVCEELGRHCSAVNGALGDTGTIEHVALTRLALRGHTVKTLVYGFYDLQMASDFSAKNSDLIGNRMILYFQEPELTVKYAGFDAFNRLSFEVYRHFPLLIERGAIWEKVELFRRSLGQLGMPKAETNRFGRKFDFDQLESKDTNTFKSECESTVQSGVFLNAPVGDLIKQAVASGAKVIVVEMPIHPMHVRRFYDPPFWEEVRAKTRKAVENAGASYINASHWLPDEDLYIDHLHLGKPGAAQFSRMLAKQLISHSLRR